MLVIAIDGACRRNGKPDCVSSAGVFIQVLNDGRVVGTSTQSTHEHESTNQRGELLALLLALKTVRDACQDAQIITDSEYLFNAMTKNWCANWENKGWRTASNEPVKNKDLWELISFVSKQIETDVNYYHIKGHCISFGKVTATRLLEDDTSGGYLMCEVDKKFDSMAPTKEDTFAAAQDLSLRNNGFRLPEEIFKRFVVANTVVDAVATAEVERADRER